MPNQGKYRVIAALLLTVFSLNTVVGFACSVGLDMGYNSTHHYEEETTESVVHIHADGKKHIHQEKKKNHGHGNSYHHDQTSNHHKSSDQKDNCCNDEVATLVQADKSLPPCVNIIHPIFQTAFFDDFLNVTLPSLDIVKDIKQFVRSYHPPISDIRIAIQSFQI